MRVARALLPLGRHAGWMRRGRAVDTVTSGTTSFAQRRQRIQQLIYPPCSRCEWDDLVCRYESVAATRVMRSARCALCSVCAVCRMPLTVRTRARGRTKHKLAERVWATVRVSASLAGGDCWLGWPWPLASWSWRGYWGGRRRLHMPAYVQLPSRGRSMAHNIPSSVCFMCW
jgi:hypothetical protein